MGHPVHAELDGQATQHVACNPQLACNIWRTDLANHMLVHQLKDDKAAHCTRMAHETRTCPRHALADGRTAASYDKYRQRWRRLFAQNMGGQLATCPQLLTRLLGEQGARGLMHYDIYINARPTQAEIGMVLANANKQCSQGEEVLPGEVFACAPHHLAQVMWQVRLKSSLRLQAPLVWEGECQQGSVRRNTINIVATSAEL